MHSYWLFRPTLLPLSSLYASRMPPIGYKREGYLWLLPAPSVPLDTCMISILKNLGFPNIRCFHSLLLTVHNNNRVRYFATFCITSGTYTTIGLIIAWCMFQSSTQVLSVFLEILLTSRPQPRIRNEESHRYTNVHGDWPVWKCSRIPHLPDNRGSTLYVSHYIVYFFTT